MKVLIADDELPARRWLRKLCDEIGGIEVVGETASGLATLDEVERLAPDVVLLDIEMPALDGLSVAASPGFPAVVFVTAHEAHARAAFDLDAADYLLKPVRAARLAEALTRARRRLPDAREEWLRVRDGATLRFFAASRTDRLTASHKYTVFQIDGVEHLSKEPLDALEERLRDAGFVRVHRAELVRTAAIRSWTATATEHHLVLRDGVEVSVSRRYAARVKAALAR